MAPKGSSARSKPWHIRLSNRAIHLSHTLTPLRPSSDLLIDPDIQSPSTAIARRPRRSRQVTYRTNAPQFSVTKYGLALGASHARRTRTAVTNTQSFPLASLRRNSTHSLLGALSAVPLDAQVHHAILYPQPLLCSWAAMPHHIDSNPLFFSPCHVISKPIACHRHLHGSTQVRHNPMITPPCCCSLPSNPPSPLLPIGSRSNFPI